MTSCRGRQSDTYSLHVWGCIHSALHGALQTPLDLLHETLKWLSPRTKPLFLKKRVLLCQNIWALSTSRAPLVTTKKTWKCKRAGGPPALVRRNLGMCSQIFRSDQPFRESRSEVPIRNISTSAFVVSLPVNWYHRNNANVVVPLESKNLHSDQKQKM